MMVANSFDLWQKDAFFTAAEEVQHSADIMESAYRNWARQRREGLDPRELNELCRELQTAFGTAKWQLEEFEKAVKSSYGNRADELTKDRHRQFVNAIENQIAHVEAELEKSYNEEGKQPLRWVNLDEGECDDLAMFLSGTRKTLQGPDDGHDTKLGKSTKCLPSEKQCIVQNTDIRVNCDPKGDVPRQTKGLKNVNLNMDDSYIIEVGTTNESPETSDSSCSQADRKIGTRRNWSTPNFGSLSITIDAKNDAMNVLMSSVEATPKEKGTKPVFWKPTFGDQLQAMRGINRINQLFRIVLGSQRQLQTLVLQRNRSFQLILALMIAALLIVPFAFYTI
ncbi:Syntaxin/t-SNARE family protein [Heracleum sosnowskyi]|uniref:Syntaxin/t-SNARE family protein n=1 Tax=Heracleum sosnowskyi TaxID=360622 RepID=A0AAD8HIH5_9APIA|nr:Syntaxin/t-SNARE family protein [Heracleum sosnowskyi]